MSRNSHRPHRPRRSTACRGRRPRPRRLGRTLHSIPAAGPCDERGGIVVVSLRYPGDLVVAPGMRGSSTATTTTTTTVGLKKASTGLRLAEEALEVEESAHQRGEEASIVPHSPSPPPCRRCRLPPPLLWRRNVLARGGSIRGARRTGKGKALAQDDRGFFPRCSLPDHRLPVLREVEWVPGRSSPRGALIAGLGALPGLKPSRGSAGVHRGGALV